MDKQKLMSQLLRLEGQGGASRNEGEANLSATVPLGDSEVSFSGGGAYGPWGSGGGGRIGGSTPAFGGRLSLSADSKKPSREFMLNWSKEF